MKIVFLITKLDYSGGPKMLAWVANQFAKNGDEVSIISIYSDLKGQYLEKNIVFIPLNLVQSNNRLRRNTIDMIVVLRRLNKKIKDIEPDMIVSFMYSVDMYYLFINKFSNRNMIVAPRLDPYSDKGIAAWVRYKLVSLADGVVFQTEGARRFFNGEIQKIGTVIPNPVTNLNQKHSNNMEKFCNRDNVIILSGRLNIHQKRQDLMIKAFVKISNKFDDVKLIILGNGPDKVKLKALIDSLGLESKILIHQAITKKNEYFEYIKKSKMLVLTSDFEGIPNSLLEGMALGLPVVSTDCSPGGARLLIRDGENGFIVKRNDIDDLVVKICEIIKNEDLADELGNNAKKDMLEFTEEKVAKKWINYIVEVRGRKI